MIAQTINVSLISKYNNISYPIFVGNNLLSNCDEILKKFVVNRKIILIHDDFFSFENGINENLIAFVKTIIKFSKSLNFISLPGGDKTKNISQLNFVLEKSLSFEIDRNSLVIAFGGGVIGDIAGFTASILLRGIDYIHVPTTLLAQVDSSVGGKTGINSNKGKNLIGSFHQPIAVMTDINMLKTLSKRELNVLTPDATP